MNGFINRETRYDMLRKIAMALENTTIDEPMHDAPAGIDFMDSPMIADTNESPRIIKESTSQSALEPGSNIDSIFVEWCLS